MDKKALQSALDAKRSYMRRVLNRKGKDSPSIKKLQTIEVEIKTLEKQIQAHNNGFAADGGDSAAAH